MSRLSCPSVGSWVVQVGARHSGGGPSLYCFVFFTICIWLVLIPALACSKHPSASKSRSVPGKTAKPRPAPVCRPFVAPALGLEAVLNQVMQGMRDARGGTAASVVLMGAGPRAGLLAPQAQAQPTACATSSKRGLGSNGTLPCDPACDTGGLCLSWGQARAKRRAASSTTTASDPGRGSAPVAAPPALVSASAPACGSGEGSGGPSLDSSHSHHACTSATSTSTIVRVRDVPSWVQVAGASVGTVGPVHLGAPSSWPPALGIHPNSTSSTTTVDEGYRSRPAFGAQTPLLMTARGALVEDAGDGGGPGGGGERAGGRERARVAFNVLDDLEDIVLLGDGGLLEFLSSEGAAALLALLPQDGAAGSL